MRNFTDNLADLNGQFKFLVRGVFQHIDPPISAMFRENAEVYFHRWLVNERLDINVDVNDEQTMHQYGLAFSEHLRASRTDITVPPGPDKAYVDLKDGRNTLANDSDDDDTQYGNYSVPGSLDREEGPVAKTPERASTPARQVVNSNMSDQIDDNLNALFNSFKSDMRGSNRQAGEFESRLSPVLQREGSPAARSPPRPVRRDPESFTGQSVARVFDERLFSGKVTMYLRPVAEDDEPLWQIGFDCLLYTSDAADE